jgi:hypothetical protein
VPGAGAVVDRARRLQAVVVAITTRAAELAGRPDRPAEAVRLLDAATQVMTLLGDRLGGPAAAPSVDLVTPAADGSVRFFGYVTLHNARGSAAMRLRKDDLGTIWLVHDNATRCASRACRRPSGPTS